MENIVKMYLVVISRDLKTVVSVYMAGRVSKRRARDFGDMLWVFATFTGTRESASLISASDKYAAFVSSGRLGKKH